MSSLRHTLTPLALLATAATITACGSTSPAHTGSSTTSPSQAQIQRLNVDAIRFTDCMRNHGISFPDPPTTKNPSAGRAWKSAFQNSSPAFATAMTACHHYLPATKGGSPNSKPSHAELAAMLAFARCMRGHGFARFPDPNSSGITHEMLAAAGIDLHQPALKQAADTCTAVTGGLLTRADVARFIAGH